MLDTIRHELDVRRALGVTRRPRRQPRMLPPISIEREYARRLLAYVALARSAFEPVLAELPHLLAAVARERGDERQDAGEASRLRALIAAARDRLARSISPVELEQLAREFAGRVSRYNRDELIKQTRAALGVDVLGPDRKLSSIVEGFVAENVELIRDIPEQLASDIGATTLRAVQAGTLHKELARELENRFGVATNRAKLIARDQVGKLRGQINVARQKELGVDEYIWRTMHDVRVRGTPGGKFPHAKPSHYARDGKTFSFDKPPDGGNPGEPVLCRCFAEPKFDKLIEGWE